MPIAIEADALILALDTCGERASLALFRGSQLVEEVELAERTASATVIGALRSLLARWEARTEDLSGIGVVSGPGSFTGVRVGLAVAKGLCEATGVALAAVSRLEVLASAARLTEGWALLAAGRGQVYARSVGAGGGRESLTTIDQLAPELQRKQIAVDSEDLAAILRELSAVRRIRLSARHAFGPVMRCLCDGGSDLALVDANYVRNEEAIYRSGLVNASAI